MKKWATAAKILFGVAMLAFILSNVDPRETLATLAAAKPGYVAAALLCLLVGTIFQVLRWQMILRVCDVRTPFGWLMRIQFIGLFFNSFLLGSVGGDLVKTLYLGELKDYARLLSATLFARILGGLATFLVAWGTLWGAPEIYRAQPWWTACMLVLTLAALASLVFLVLPVEKLFLRLSNIALPSKWQHRLDNIAGPLHSWRSNPGVALATTALAILFQIFGFIFVVYFSAYAVHIQIPLTTIALIAAIAAIALALPISINGIGVTEGTYVYLFTLYGVSAEKALSLALLCRLYMILFAVIGGLVYLRKPLRAG